MFRKIVFVACVVVLSMAMEASAQTWTNGTGDGKWNTAGNWAEGAVPVMVPDQTGAAYISRSGLDACVLDGTGPQGICQWAWIGTAGTGELNVVAGGLLGTPEWGPGETFVGHEGAGCNGDGIVNVDGEGTIARSERWKIGSDVGGRTGVVNITNGGQMVGVWWGNFVYSTGTINLRSGTILILGLGDFAIDDGGVINISGTSTITMDGDREVLIQGYIDAGKITGTSSSCPAEVYFDEDLNQTIVSVVGCPCSTFHAMDFNYDCYVDLLDLVNFAGSWLTCTDPLNEACL